MVCLVAALVALPMRRGLGAERDSVAAAGMDGEKERRGLHDVRQDNHHLTEFLVRNHPAAKGSQRLEDAAAGGGTNIALATSMRRTSSQQYLETRELMWR